MESTAGNNTKKLNVKVINVMEESVINDTLVNVGFTMNTEGVKDLYSLNAPGAETDCSVRRRAIWFNSFDLIII